MDTVSFINEARIYNGGKTSKMTQIDGEIYHVHGSEESI